VGMRAVGLLVVFAACTGSAPSPSITVVDPFAPEPVTGDVGAVYATLRNDGNTPDTLDGASADIAAMAHLHRMTGTGGTQMRGLTEVEIPVGGSLRLAPGGLHLMLMELRERPTAGDTFTVTFRFRHAGSVEVRVPVVSYLEVGERAAVGEQEGAR